MSAPQDPNFQAPPPPPMPEEEPVAPRPTKKLWPIAIGVFVLGLIFVVGGIAKFLSGGIGTGGALCFFGALLFGLSFVRLPLVPNPEAPLCRAVEPATGSRRLLIRSLAVPAAAAGLWRCRAA